MNNIPREHPLMTIDREGKQIKVGDKVTTPTLPNWFISDNNGAAKDIHSGEGPVMIVYGMDEHGYVRLETIIKKRANSYQSRRFGMEPYNLLIL